MSGLYSGRQCINVKVGFWQILGVLEIDEMLAQEGGKLFERDKNSVL